MCAGIKLYLYIFNAVVNQITHFLVRYNSGLYFLRIELYVFDYAGCKRLSVFVENFCVGGEKIARIFDYFTASDKLDVIGGFLYLVSSDMVTP